MSLIIQSFKADKIVAGSVHVLCDQPYLKQQTSENLGLPVSGSVGKRSEKNAQYFQHVM